MTYEQMPDEWKEWVDLTPLERFRRSETSRHRAPGTGLGLAIARSYAQAHGGALVYAPADPRGARFELVLPA